MISKVEIERLRNLKRGADHDPRIEALDEYVHEAQKALPGVLDDVEALQQKLESLQGDYDRLSADYARVYGAKPQQAAG